MWFVSDRHPDHPGVVVAWGIVADSFGGERLPFLLVSDSLDGVRRLLPVGLVRREPSMVMDLVVTETWD